MFNKEIIKVVNYLSPDEPDRSVNYDFSQWALENFDRLTPDKVLAKISEMIDDPDSGVCLKFGRQWVQTNKENILAACREVIGITEAPKSPEPILRESLKFLKRFDEYGNR